VNRSAALIAAVSSLLVPAAAGAATVQTAADGRVVYRAGPGELNDVAASDGVFMDAGARIRAGAGCHAGPPVTCAPGDTELRLGNRDDRGRLQVDAFRTARVWGEQGRDLIDADGGETFADGGPGHDTVDVGAHGSAVGWGGPGRDRLHASARGFAVLTGGDGADVLTGGAPNATFDGGYGADAIDGVLEAFGTGRMLGGAGADRLTASGESGWRIEGGDGRDTITATSVGTDTIACGNGRDVVFAGPEDAVAADCEIVL
jgi:Ca2+-binding RTX toxin-like protein